MSVLSQGRVFSAESLLGTPVETQWGCSRECLMWGGKGPLELSGTEGLRVETLDLYFVCPAELGRSGSQCAKMLVWGIRQILHFCSFALLPGTQAGEQIQWMNSSRILPYL